MQKWEWSLTTNTIWTNFDHGYVFANTIEEAKVLAIAEYTKCIKEANEALSVVGFTVDGCSDDITIEHVCTVDIKDNVNEFLKQMSIISDNWNDIELYTLDNYPKGLCSFDELLFNLKTFFEPITHNEK